MRVYKGVSLQTGRGGGRTVPKPGKRTSKPADLGFHAKWEGKCPACGNLWPERSLVCYVQTPTRKILCHADCAAKARQEMTRRLNGLLKTNEQRLG